MTQTARPISDTSVGTWTTAPLWSKVNDASDATFITSPVGANTACEVKLASLTDPVASTGHWIYARAMVANGSGTAESLYFHLYQGNTLLASGLFYISRTTITTYAYDLTETQANNITDYADLRIRVEPWNVAAGESINAFDVWFECPGIDAAPITASTVAATVAIPTPTITAFSPATPNAVAATVAIPTPALTGDASLEPTTVAAYIGVGSPDIPIPESPTVYPDTIALGLGIGDNWSAVATATTGGAGEVTAYRVCVDAYIPLITVAAGAGTAPDTVSVLADIPAPVLSGGADVTGTTVAATVAVPAPTVSTADPDAVVTPDTVAVTAAIPEPGIAGENITVSGETEQDAVAVLVTVPAPTVTGTQDAAVAPDTVVVTAAVSSALVSTTRIRLHRHYRRRPLSTGGYALEVYYR